MISEYVSSMLQKTRERKFCSLVSTLKAGRDSSNIHIDEKYLNINMLELFQFLKQKDKLKGFLEVSEPFFNKYLNIYSISKSDLKEMYKLCYYTEEILHLYRSNYSLFSTLITNSDINFDRFVENLRFNSILWIILRNKQNIKSLYENGIVSVENLLNLYNTALLDESFENIASGRSNFRLICEGTTVLFSLIEKNQKTIQDIIIDSSKSQNAFETFLANKELFQQLFQANLLRSEDLHSIIDSITSFDEVEKFISNYVLFEKCIESDVLNNQTFSKFNELWIDSVNGQCDAQGEIHQLPREVLQKYKEKIFDAIDYAYTHSATSKISYTSSALKYSSELTKEFKNFQKKILTYSKAFRTTFTFDSFTTQERLELYRIVNDSEKAKDILTRIIDNNLQDQYDFESLKRVLTKDEKKQKIKMNF